ncbi:MAG TPA: hypothetical protein DIV79_11665 [Opitutae bacterium]|nr:hypothetical protein [Opitutae bacterium]
MRGSRFPIIIAFLFLIQTGCKTAEQEKVAIDVMSFNIRYGLAKDGDNHWDNRHDLVFETIRDYEPSILGLQEALHFQLQEILGELPSYSSNGVGREADGGGEHTAILYSTELFELIDHDTVWLSDTPEKPSSSWGNNLFRTCTWSLFRFKALDKEFYVYNTHFDHKSEESRERSAEFIAGHIAKRERSSAPFLLLGDFNAGEETLPIKSLLDQKGEAQLVDTFRAIHPEEPNAGTFGAWVGKIDGAKIDYVFTDIRMEVLDAAIVRQNENGRYPSDHYPVIARVRF